MTLIVGAVTAYALLVCLTGYVGGKTNSDPTGVAWACIFAPLGVVIMLGIYAYERGLVQRSALKREADHLRDLDTIRRDAETLKLQDEVRTERRLLSGEESA